MGGTGGFRGLGARAVGVLTAAPGVSRAELFARALSSFGMGGMGAMAGRIPDTAREPPQQPLPGPSTRTELPGGSGAGEKYIRKQYKPKYTHGTHAIAAPFSASIIAKPTALDINLGDGKNDFGEVQADDEVTLQNAPICASCNKALQVEAADEAKWLWALPCGHVIDGDCRDRLAKRGKYESLRETDVNAKADSTIGDESVQILEHTKRARDTDDDEVNVNVVEVFSSSPADAAAPPASKRQKLARGGGQWKDAGGDMNAMIPCPVRGCQERWKYKTGEKTSAIHLFV